MNKQKIASLLLYIVSIAIVAFGALYIYTGFTSGLMPYHIKFLGKTCDELPPNVCALMRTFVQIIGFAFLAIGVVFFILVQNIFSEQPSSWKMLVVITAVLMPVILIMYRLASYTPWYIVAGILVLAIIGLILAKQKK